MNKLLANLGDRDRRILRWALPVAALLLALIVGRHLVVERQLASGRLQLALEDIAWLQSQGEALAQRRCERVPLDTQGLARLAAQNGVQLADGPVSGPGGIRLDIAAAHGNRVLALVADVECRGGRIAELNLDTLDDSGSVKGILVVVPAVT